MSRVYFDGPGRIYFASAGDFIKIGWARSDVAARIAAMQVGCPLRIKLLRTRPGSLRQERRLHEKFASARVHGEWFHATAELQAYIFKTPKVKSEPPSKVPSHIITECISV